jgi:serine/threonine protein kinase
VADLGFAIEEKDKGYAVANGTPGYIAPEILNHKDYSFNSDVFSIGCILFKLVSAQNLFDGQSAQDVLLANKVWKNNHLEFKAIKCSDLCYKFLQKLLQQNQEKRPDARVALEDEWFNQNRS